MSQSDIENAIRDGHGERQINDGQANWLIESTLEEAMYAHYDREADISWLPAGASDDVVSERVPVDYGTTTALPTR